MINKSAIEFQNVDKKGDKAGNSWKNDFSLLAATLSVQNS